MTTESITYQDAAAQALSLTDKEVTTKGRATSLTFIALYLASKEETFSNLALPNIAKSTDKQAKSNDYKLVFSEVFKRDTEESGRAIPSSFSNKLKLGLDVLAYVDAAERFTGQSLVIIKGDKAKVNGLLLNPEDETEAECWYSLDAGSKMRTSLAELKRKANKYMAIVNGGEALPSRYDVDGVGAKGSNKAGDKSQPVSTKDMIAVVTSHVAAMAGNPLSADMADALDVLRDCITEALVKDAEAREAKQAKKKAA